jgi:hypothetical protein
MANGKTPKFEISVFDDENVEYKCQLSPIDRVVLEIVIGLIMPTGGEKPKYLQAGELILNSCWVSGDEQIRKDEQLLISACMSAYKLFELKKTILKKL